jgi:DNA-directed RNA polymerase subunit M/transcription elongation factor TFIIS
VISVVLRTSVCWQFLLPILARKPSFPMLQELHSTCVMNRETDWRLGLVPAPTTSIISESKPEAFPSALQKKHSKLQEVKPGHLQSRATIQQECPKCASDKMWYSELQLRSADEGTTLFFECPDCGYKWVASGLLLRILTTWTNAGPLSRFTLNNWRNCPSVGAVGDIICCCFSTLSFPFENLPIGLRLSWR